MIGPADPFAAPRQKPDDPLSRAIRLQDELLASQGREQDARKRMRGSGQAVRSVLADEVKEEKARQESIRAELESLARTARENP